MEESLVYNSIRKNGNDGATIKAISIDTKLNQSRLPRILKSLIGRKLIKELPVLAGSKQKIYLLAELEPSQQLAANTLFAGDSGVDSEFVEMLRAACLKYINDKASRCALFLKPAIWSSDVWKESISECYIPLFYLCFIEGIRFKYTRSPQKKERFIFFRWGDSSFYY